MKKTLSFLILFVATLIFAQEAKEGKWVLKLNATQLLDFATFPTVQFSVERKLNPYFSINTEAGFQVYDLHKVDSTVLKSRGFKTNLEGRFYISKFFHKRTKSNRNEPFVGLQFFYRKDQTTDVLFYYDKSNVQNNYLENIYRDYFGLKTTALGVNITLGNQFSFGKSKKFILEPYGGFGFLNRKIKNTHLQFDETKHEIDSENQDLFRNNNLEKYSGRDGNVFFGLRIGYVL
ncbi:hypothetical protein [Chryseobacterium sp. Leaf394]|uniref:hypothetical protein n=1 Tax=Chryseobacterium sp. Leaf394 TaxID=1736361 RepID=UPI0006FD1D60|nr:hypothetical protein [Chryseobacterium sp. Leaf394]KQS91584.1 hypothetical protein ASG21_03685 [Chryseobacterium sp. Leaf394]